MRREHLRAVAALLFIPVPPSVKLAAQSLLNSRPEFEVASIKPTARPYTFMSTNIQNGRLTVHAGAARRIIATAYGVHQSLIQNAPGWTDGADSPRFEIAAKAGEGDTSRAAVLAMLRALLAERFALRIHKETRILNVRILNLAKSGSRLKTAKDDELASIGPSFVQGSHQDILVRFQFHKIGMSGLVDFLTNHIAFDEGAAKVVDQTGLEGMYDFDLTWADRNMYQTASGGETIEIHGPDLSGALQEQLGLKLESAKAPVEVIVIDRIERPSAN